jgi:hypothetical protein
LNINPTLPPILPASRTINNQTTNNRNLARTPLAEPERVPVVEVSERAVGQTNERQNGEQTRQIERITLLTRDESRSSNANFEPANSAISEYVQTEAIEKREAIESLVGLDLFV